MTSQERKRQGDGETPLRRQYLQIKARYPDAVVLFRMGDFYETFDEDARVAARELQITLTSREMGKGQRVPLAGIPYHALEGYLARLVQRGHRVAICEQLSDPAAGKGLVDRDVVRVVTPGTLVEPGLLHERANNYLAALVLGDEEAGLAYADITTSEFATTQLSLPALAAELERLDPAELLAPKGQAQVSDRPATPLEPSLFDALMARETLLEHFQTATLEAYGCEGLPLAAGAAGALLAYLRDNQRDALAQLPSLHTYSTQRYMALDRQTRRNLELFQGGRFGTGQSLLGMLDMTRTPMGGRTLRRWLGQPLLDLEELERRLGAVDWFHRSGVRREQALRLLHDVPDLERLVNRVRGSIALPREVLALRRGLELVPAMQEAVSPGPSDEEGEGAGWLVEELRPCREVADLVASALEEEPLTGLGEGGVVRRGFSPELDELRAAAGSAREYIAGLERRERERTGISSLKVGYNRVFGYYLEVTRPHLERVPPDYMRRQTLVNGERFITPELKEHESRILNAQERMAELEGTLFRQVCRQIADEAPRILATAAALGLADVFASLAEVATRNGYVRPVLTDGTALEIRDGRHPVVERSLPAGSFVPNDTMLGEGHGSLAIITGPNMSGKSTYIRQVALIVLMAQTGSFVPAQSARVGLVDRVFTRVGLQDDLTTGQSTFMVEMVETAAILHHATPRSLVVLDEIGRGTSTYDGMAIARAVAEHLHSHPSLGCKTLFATHYHELTRMAGHLPRARNYNVAVAEDGGQVVFLRRIVPGGADKSYGVHVARLAGLPRPVVSRAWELLEELEEESGGGKGGARGRRGRKDGGQLALFQPGNSSLLRELEGLDISTMTPVEALNKLYEMQQRARE